MASAHCRYFFKPRRRRGAVALPVLLLGLALLLVSAGAAQGYGVEGRAVQERGPETAFDPAANVGCAAGVLKAHHGDLKNWSRSVKRYHSASADIGNGCFDRVSANLRLIMRRRADLADAPAR